MNEAIKNAARRKLRFPRWFPRIRNPVAFWKMTLLLSAIATIPVGYVYGGIACGTLVIGAIVWHAWTALANTYSGHCMNSTRHKPNWWERWVWRNTWVEVVDIEAYRDSHGTYYENMYQVTEYMPFIGVTHSEQHMKYEEAIKAMEKTLTRAKRLGTPVKREIVVVARKGIYD